MADTTTSDAVARILETTSPDPSIRPDIWQEILKLRLALTELASAVDLKREAEANTVGYQSIGSPAEDISMWLQNLTTIKVRTMLNPAYHASLSQLADGGHVQFFHVNGEIRAMLQLGNIRADAMCIDVAKVPVGGEATFILAGLHAAPNLNEWLMKDSTRGNGITGPVAHWRVATGHDYNSYGQVNLDFGPFWFGQNAGRTTADKYIGHAVAYNGAYSSPGYSFILMNFNPKRNY